jgi:hypothetical protein
LSSDRLGTAVGLADLESLLHLAHGLFDQTSAGCMRDSDALRLFSISNGPKCLSLEQMNGFPFLLPWACQEGVIRASEVSRDERLITAVLGCQLLLYYFDLSSVPSLRVLRRSSHTTRRSPSLWPGIRFRGDFERVSGTCIVCSPGKCELVVFSDGHTLSGELVWPGSSIVPGR